MCIGSSKVKETEYERELARVGAEWANRYFGPFAEQERLQLREIDRLGSEREKQRLSGRITADIQMAQPTITPGAGFDPTSGRFANVLSTATAARGAAMGQGLTLGEQAGENAKLEGKLSAIAMGRGIQNRGLTGLSRTAYLEQGRAIADAAATAAQQTALAESAATLAGYGFRRMRPTSAGINAAMEQQIALPNRWLDADSGALRRVGGYA